MIHAECGGITDICHDKGKRIDARDKSARDGKAMQRSKVIEIRHRTGQGKTGLAAIYQYTSVVIGAPGAIYYGSQVIEPGEVECGCERVR